VLRVGCRLCVCGQGEHDGGDRGKQDAHGGTLLVSRVTKVPTAS
jgi:hypothetical protein